jgi:hypothetical protein
MSISFLERLVERATGKQPTVQIKPALTPDMIPEAFQMPEGTLSTYPFQLGEAGANKSQNSYLNLPSHKQVKTDFATAQTNPEKANKPNAKENVPVPIDHKKSDMLNRAEDSHVQENLKQSPSLSEEATFPNETTLQNATKKALTNKEMSPSDINSFPKVQERTAVFVVPSDNGSAELQLREVLKQTGNYPEAARNNGLSAKEISEDQQGIIIVAKRISVSTNLEKTDTIESEGKSSKAPFQQKTSSLFEAKEQNETGDYAQRLLEQSAEGGFAVPAQQESPPIKLNLVSIKPYSNIDAAERWPRPQKETENIITIHIGRIEVHVAKEQEQPINPPRSPVLSLNDYLKQRSEEK